ncbi:MAG TPA: glycerophosphodiester phosphodiesterase [Gemmatimonadales bacterium]|nr:glycerophosphodiester phosphodiesterase [Gemmatimonadales bacterium]
MAGPALVIAHRGASAYQPENSLAAFRTALDMGADGIELDVHDTSDGAMLVHHDPEIDGHLIQSRPAAAFGAHRLSNGEPVPALEDALAAIGPGAMVYVEVKSLTPSHDPALLARLAAAPAPQRCHVHGFDHRIVRRLRQARPNLTGGVLSTSYPVDPWSQLTAAGATELWQHHSMIDPELVAGAHARGVAVFAWTVDDPGRLRALLEMEVDGVCTNCPDVARRVVDQC